MEDWTTPPVMARELGVTPTGIRFWLQRNGRTVDTDGFWRIDEATAAEMRAYYAYRARPPEPGPCSVEGCDRPRTSRRAELCRMHRRRQRLYGTLEGRAPGANQRAKTHCPAGHEYTPENTYRFKDGRRRCRRCRIEQAKASALRARAVTDAGATPRARPGVGERPPR